MGKSLAFIFGVFLILTQAAFAEEVTKWEIDPENSHLRFEASQSGAPVVGQFNEFNGLIAFDPDKLDRSIVHLDIIMESLSIDYQSADSELRKPEWLDIVAFPESHYHAESFELLETGQYKAKGTLRIKEKTVETELVFDLIIEENRAFVKGETVINRLDFTVGEGEWESTAIVDDPVKITFEIQATKSE